MGCFNSKKQIQKVDVHSYREQIRVNQLQSAIHYADIVQDAQKQRNPQKNIKKEQQKKQMKQKGHLYVDFELYNLKYSQDQYFLFTNLQNQMYQKFVKQEFDEMLLEQKENKDIILEGNQHIKLKYQIKQFSMVDTDEHLSFMRRLFKKSNLINYASAIFFKIGGVQMYTDDILILEDTGFEQVQNYIWYPLGNQSEKLKRSVSIPDQVLEILQNAELFSFAQNYGRFIIYQQKWGYLLDIQGCSSFYNGVLSSSWEKLLLTSYFQDIIKRYAEYVLEVDAEEKLQERSIPTSFDDSAVNPLIVSFNDILFEHQKKEVGWMSNLEFNPFLTFNNDLEYIALLDTGFFFHPRNPQKLLKKHELTQKQYYMPGGILASEIGSGKTISVIALTTIGSQLSDASYRSHWAQYNNTDKDALMMMPAGDRFDIEAKAQVYERLNIAYDGVYLPSLIIVTKNILYQWNQEYKQFAPKLRVLVVENWELLIDLAVIEVFGSLTKKKYLIFRDYDIILTHRTAIQNAQMECPKINQLFDIHFNRIVYDEMHEISSTLIGYREKQKEESKESDLDQQDVLFKKNIPEFFKAIQKIKRRFSWGITGTPDNLNFSNDSFPMVFLLNLCDEYYTLNQYDRLQDKFIQNNMRSNPKSVDLPSLTKKVVDIFMKQIQNIIVQGKSRSKFNDEQSARETLSHFSQQYDFLEELDEKQFPQAIKMICEMQEMQKKKIQEQMQTEKDQGRKNYLSMRVEQLMSEDNFYQDIIKIIKNPKFECNICYEEQKQDQLVVTHCFHNFCYNCFESLCKHLAYPDCPFCNQQVSKQNVLIHPDLLIKSDSKLEKLISDYRQLPIDDKVIIFTQFHDLTKKISQKLQLIDIPHVLLLGEPSEVNIRLHTFKTVPEVRILIMSIEQAASGINLIEANHVFFMHPIFGTSYDKSRSTYAQCIGRALRVGQSKPVTASMYVTKNSIETTLSQHFIENQK